VTSVNILTYFGNAELSDNKHIVAKLIIRNCLLSVIQTFPHEETNSKHPTLIPSEPQSRKRRTNLIIVALGCK